MLYNLCQLLKDSLLLKYLISKYIQFSRIHKFKDASKSQFRDIIDRKVISVLFLLFEWLLFKTIYNLHFRFDFVLPKEQGITGVILIDVLDLVLLPIPQQSSLRVLRLLSLLCLLSLLHYIILSITGTINRARRQSTLLRSMFGLVYHFNISIRIITPI